MKVPASDNSSFCLLYEDNDIKGIACYRVIFMTTNYAALGPITVYLDKNSCDVLGVEFRD